MMALGGLLLLVAGTPVFASDDRPIEVSELPASARQFIKTHFAGAQVSHATVDGHLFDKEYKVVFTDGREIEFGKNGDWEEVDANRGQFPMEVLPQSIRSYLGQHFPDTPVMKADRDRRGYEVKLRNGFELEFDKDGRLYKIDD
ncbi:MAG: PepSY-like domain-containing protein [Alistipes sp.]|nr:PepSY-like domain-containing protein [Alistipes sp.]